MAIGLTKLAGVGAALAIGVLAGGHALSSNLARSAPQLAASLSPYAVEAWERQATGSIALAPGNTAIDVSGSQAAARQAFLHGGLSTESAAILALAQDDPASRAGSLDALDELTLRGRVFNYAALQSAAANGDGEAAMDVLDRMMTLYPSVRIELVPALAQYLTREQAIPAFEQVLQGDPEWADEFFEQAAANPAVVRNLARLRIAMHGRISLTPATDRRLLGRLVQADAWTEAFALHDLLGPAAQTAGADPQGLGWDDSFPPFDWALADERDFHARPNSDGSAIEVRIDSGRGGEFASRLAARPEGKRGIAVVHAIDPVESLEDLTVTVRCAETGATILEETFSPSPMRLLFNDNPCRWVAISFAGRAWSGSPRIAGQISSVSFLD